jgi:hypothetical protein
VWPRVPAQFLGFVVQAQIGFPLTPLRLFEALQGCMVLCCALKEVAMSRMQWKKIAQEFMFPLFHSHTLSTNIPVYEC